MWNSRKSVKLSIVVCFIFAAVLVVLIFAGPWAFENYMTAYRGFNPGDEALHRLLTVFAACFYPSAVFAAVVLFSLIKLLYNIKAEKIFIEQNVTHLKAISWSCCIVAIITFIGAFFYMPFFFIAIASGFVGILLRVLKNMMQAAVELRCENDLTI